MSTIVFRGIAASPGIGIGKVFLLEKEDIVVVRVRIRKEDVKKEILRFRKALEKTKKQFREDKEQMLRILGKTHARLADAYLLILEDPILTKDVEKEIAKECVNAEYVVQTALDKISHTFDALQDDYFKERKNDILEVGNKILQHLTGKERKKFAEMTEGSIVVAHNLLPSDTVALKTGLIRGFVINVGGKTSHTALLAQSLEIPAVVGMKDISTHVRAGQTLIVDGNQGLVILDPDRQALAHASLEKEIILKEAQELKKLRNLPAQTLDGKRIELVANIETSEDVKAVQSHGAEGIGLFRTEYLFMNRTSLPTEEEQYLHYVRALKKMETQSTVFRTLDIGGDKLSPFIQGYAHEDNPFMGLRALRFCLKYPDIFRTQLRALLRASAEGRMKIMLPMVSTVQEIIQAKEIIESVKFQLTQEGQKINSNLEVGVMIEVPSAALTADILANHVDFFSLGTNDLIQYTFAVDRVNENVASLYDPMHLSILRLIQFVVNAAHSKNKPVGICGEMASDANLTPILLGLGLDSLSVVPSFVPKIKKIIRSTNFAEAQKITIDALSSKTDTEIYKKLEQMKAAKV